MDRLRRAAVLSRLVEKMRQQGSWSGETHIQKAVYFLQELLKVPMDFEFVIYRHGPFSFDLRGELTELRGDNILRLEPQPAPYGPKIGTGEQAQYIQGLFGKTLGRFEPHIEFVSSCLGTKDVNELERLSTAHWVLKHRPSDLEEEQVAELTRLKRHIPSSDALDALQQVKSMTAEAHRKSLA